jgi:predicted DCC family thiol-disulfide oxidoreductase YuxK
MVCNHLVKFLVTKDQLHKLKTNASLKGHKTLSSYMRDVGLNRDLFLEKMLVEIHNQVVKNERAKSESGNSGMDSNNRKSIEREKWHN